MSRADLNALAAILATLAGVSISGCVLQLDLRKVDTGSERTLELGTRRGGGGGGGEKEGPPAKAGGPSEAWGQ